MKKTSLVAGAAVALSTSFTAGAAESDKPQYLSDWRHQSVNVAGSYYTRFGPQIHSDTYLEYEAFVKKNWFDFYGYIDTLVFFDDNSATKGIRNSGSPLFMETESCSPIDKLTNIDLSFRPFKEWYSMNSYIYDMGRNDSREQGIWYMGLGTDIGTGLPMGPPLSVYAKYQWRGYGAFNEDEWDGYRLKVKYFTPLTDLWGGLLNYIGFTSFDWGSNLGDDNFYDLNGKHARTSSSIASSHTLALNYAHWHYSVVAYHFHNGGQRVNGVKLNFSGGDFSARSAGWGGYFVIGYNF